MSIDILAVVRGPPVSAVFSEIVLRRIVFEIVVKDDWNRSCSVGEVVVVVGFEIEEVTPQKMRREKGKGLLNPNLILS